MGHRYARLHQLSGTLVRLLTASAVRAKRSPWSNYQYGPSLSHECRHYGYEYRSYTVARRPSTGNMLVPLSSVDQNGLETTGLMIGYILKGVDSAALEAAGKRMVDKWRLLAGRLEWSKDLTTWCIRVPLEGDVSGRLKFTTSKLSTPLNVPITPVDQDSLEILASPSLKFFRHSSTPSSLKALSSTNAPIVSIHVTELTNCTCVGISVPHGVFPAFGLGQIMEGLDAELNGRSWTPPASSEVNIMQEVNNELASAAPLHIKDPQAFVDTQRELVGATVKNMARFGVRFAYEHLWKNAEVGEVYLGNNIVEKMAQQVKDEVKESGIGWVSTGDVLVAWFLKAAFSQERDANAVSVSTIIATNDLLAAQNPAFQRYSHNAIMLTSWPLLSKTELASKSLAELSLLNRQNIDAVRNIPFFQAYNRWLAAIGGGAIFRRRRGVDSLAFSNQTVGHFERIDFGSEIAGFWLWTVPIFPDHGVGINKLKDGYILVASLRRSRWNAIAKEMERMRKS